MARFWQRIQLARAYPIILPAPVDGKRVRLYSTMIVRGEQSTDRLKGERRTGKRRQTGGVGALRVREDYVLKRF